MLNGFWKTKFGKKDYFSLGKRVISITAVIMVLLFIFVIPVKNYHYVVGDDVVQNAFQVKGISGSEQNPAGYKFSWTTGTVTLLYNYVPRYSDLHLKLRANLTRPDNVAPGHIEIYESAADGSKDPARLVGTIDFQPNVGVHDYDFRVPARPSHDGLLLEIKSNNFKVTGDPRSLGFQFLENELSFEGLPVKGLLWPQPFWEAVALLVAAISAWAFTFKLNWLENLLLAGMSGFTLVTLLESIYTYSWVILIFTGLIWALFWWQWFREGRNYRLSIWPTLVASALLVGIFLFSDNAHFNDLDVYHQWMDAVSKNSVWNIYNFTLVHNPAAYFNYLPLYAYLLTALNLVVVVFGIQNTEIAFRVLFSLLFIGVVYFTILTGRLIVLKSAPGGEGSSPVEPDNGSELPDNKDTKPNNGWWLLLALNAALFYNPAVWGQSDMMATLVLAIFFYLLNRRMFWSGSVAFGIALISKPQAWFVLPVMAWFFIRYFGWKRGIIGLGAAGVLAAVLSGIAFGLDPQAVWGYITQPQLGGDYANYTSSAFNLSYLVLGTIQTVPPFWLTLVGFAAVAIVLGWICYLSWRRNRFANSPEGIAFGAGLLGFACFAWLIKMKERYLIYGLPMLILSATRLRQLYLPILTISWLQLFSLIIGLSDANPAPIAVSLYRADYWPLKRTLGDSFYLWSKILTEDWLRNAISVAVLLCFGWLSWTYLRQTRKII